MNRRGFFRLLGGVVAVGAAIGIHPKLLSPIKKALPSDGPIHVDGIGLRVYWRELTETEIAWAYSRPGSQGVRMPLEGIPIEELCKE